MSRLERNFLTLVMVLVAFILIIGYHSFSLVTDSVIRTWGQKMAESQVNYNAGRLLKPIEREIALVNQMASSPTLIDWAQDSRNDDLYAEAMRELESFRKNFASESFFIAIKGTREYYYNNSSGEYTGNELQYILRENRPADKWFFSLIEQNRDLHININPDVELGVTKLWIDVLMRDSKGEVLAVLGTGILLEEVIEDLLAPSQDGVISMFVDNDGAIQLYQDSRIIDFSSFVKPEGQKRTLDLVVDRPEEGQQLIDILKSLQKNPELQQV